MVFSNYISRGLYSLIVFTCLDSQFISSPQKPTTSCLWRELLLEWEYPETDLDTVTWSRSNTRILKVDSNGTILYAANYVEYVRDGKVKITSTSVTDSGEYHIEVAYRIGSEMPSLEDTVIVNILDSPTGLSFTKSSETYTCASTSLGTPAVDLLIRVNGIFQMGSSYTTNSTSDKIECCFSGDAATSIAGATNPYCILVQGQSFHCVALSTS